MSRQSLLRVSLAPVALGLYWAVLFAGTHLPQGALPATAVNDKLLHGGAFLGLSLLLAFAVSLKRQLNPRWYLAVFLVVLAYGGADELTQKFVPGRTADVLDWIADALGAALGLLLHGVSVGVLGCCRARAEGGGPS